MCVREEWSKAMVLFVDCRLLSLGISSRVTICDIPLKHTWKECQIYGAAKRWGFKKWITFKSFSRKVA